MFNRYWKIVLFFLLGLTFSAISMADEFADAFAEVTSTSSSRNDFEFYGGLEIEQGMNVAQKGAKYTQKPEQDWTIANRRLKLKTSKTTDKGGIFAKVYLTRDDVAQKSYIDFRELRLQYGLFKWMDLSLGRQVSTWGVGDMLFINDLFPKDWKAMFTGQDMEYLKAPSNSLRLTQYLGPVTWDIVWTPQFTPDNTPRGCHLAVFDPSSSSIIQDVETCKVENNANGRVSNDISDSELAMSLKTSLGPLEWALYGYHGFYKNPRNMDSTKKAYYPRLDVYGTSLEGQVGPGILSVEYGYYDAKEESNGANPLLENSMHKYLVGYKLDLTGQLMVGLQAYGEYMSDYDLYKASYTYPDKKKETQYTYTLRVMYKMMQDTLLFNLFHYYRPDDKDSFTQLDISKRLDNHFTVVIGANIFTGNDQFLAREFGSVRDEDNAYVRFRYDL